MKQQLVDLLVDPVLGHSLKLEVVQGENGEIQNGILRATDGSSYPIRNGIPRLVRSMIEDQQQTSDAFAYKWRRRETYDSPAVKAAVTKWYIGKYGFASLEEWVAHYARRDRILDLGCGSGFSSSLWLDSGYWPGSAWWVGADISTAVDVAQERLGHVPNTHFVQADALSLPFVDASFDAVVSEGVLHHTPSTRDALLAVPRLLRPGGTFDFYLYRRKGPIREFTDDYVRQAICEMSDEEAWEALRPLTRLGQALALVNATIRLDDGCPLLGIPAGEFPVQRLIYWNFAKLFWNSDFSFEENHHINFDWYRPRYAHRQTEAEVRQWCAEAGLRIDWFHSEESGFSVRTTRIGETGP